MKHKRFITIACLSLFAAVAVAWLFSSKKSAPSAEPSPAAQNITKQPRPDSTKSSWSALTQDDLPAYQRLELARQLPTSLQDRDVAALFAAMDHTPSSGSEEGWYVVLNEIMEQMRRYGLGSEQYAARLGAMIADSSRPEVVRDYAIQHLALWIAPGNPDQVPHEQDKERIAQSLQIISQALQAPGVAETSMPGTALLTLADISPNLPPELAAATWAALQPYLTELISGKTNAALSTQVSALQAVARTQQLQFLPTIRAIAASETADPSLRLSSIACLGTYANPADKAFLQTITSQNTRFRYAAQSALQRLTAQ